MPDDKLPSMGDFTEDPSELPSVEDFIKEEKIEENLPSVDEYIVDIEEEVEHKESDLPSVEDKIVDENLPTIEDYIEEEEVVEEDIETTGGISVQEYSPEMQFRDYEFIDIIKRPEWKELVGLVNEVKDNIPDIPEIKYYDDDLEKISETIEELRSQIPVVPEVKYYDEDIDQVKQTISDLPEVKYYDQEVNNLEGRFSELKEFVSNIPNYDDELNSLRDKFNYDIQEVSENIEVKDFERKVEIDNVNSNLKETSEKIYEELKKSSDQIHEYKLHLKDDDRKLKKQILGQYNLLKENIEKKVKEFNTKNIESQNVISGSLKEYFDELQEKISAIPEVKYYDEEIGKLNDKFEIDIKELREIVDQIKETQKQDLQENLLTEPPSTDNEDPLTPLDQKFVTYEKLQENYQLFVNRVQQQLASFGGGGETKLQYLDDIVGIATNLSAYNEMYLKVDTSQPKGKNFVFETVAAGAGGTWGSNAVGVWTGRNVGIATTARSSVALYVDGDTTITGDLNVTGDMSYDEVTGRNLNITGVATFGGNVSVAGTLTYEDVTNIDSVGLVTARKGVRITEGGLVVTAGVATVGTAITMGGGTVTATEFVGSGSGLTGVASTDYIITGTAATFNSQVKIVNLNVTGVTTATTFYGDGSGLTGVASTDNIITGTAATFNNQVNILNVSVSGASTVTGDLTVGGDLNVSGDIEYDEVTGRNWNITGVGTITRLNSTNIVGTISTITRLDATNLNVSGVSTFSNTGVGTVHIGVGTTALLVDGDARVTGILTVGRSSITIDGENNQINVGLVTVTNSTIVIGENVTIDSSASGINSAPNVLYVAKDGLDTNNGTSIDNAFLTIKAAVGAASSGTTVKVLSGKYTESNPISVPAFVSIVGDDQRAVEVKPSTTNQDIFHVRKGDKLANMTFKGHVAPAAAVAFPTDEIAENVGGGKWKGPYVQNCTSDTTTGTGIYIDGDQARLLKAMNVDSFTQYNQGGIGVAVTNGGFAQLVSLFTICCNEAVKVDKGGQADIANSNCSFGTYGLVAKGVSDLQYTGIVTSSAAISQAEAIVNVDTTEYTMNNFVYDYTSGIATVTTTAAHNFQVGMGVTLAGIGLTCDYGSKTYPYKKPSIFTVDSIPSTTSFVVNVGISTLAHHYVGTGSSAGTAKIDVDRPYDGQTVYFDKLYKQVNKITVSNGGSGYTSTPIVTIDDPDGPSGETASAYATLEDEAIKSITIISSGSQYEGTPDVTISGGGGSNGAATASMDPLYYTINSSTAVSSGITTLTLATNLLNTVGVGSTAYFSQGSKIVASSHTFEYVGSGNDIVSATPKRGGVLDQENEVITEDGGKVLYTSTDQAGNFRIGDDLKINQETGTISGRAFSKSLFSEMTPFILALS
jgi:hypothetical protein